MKVKLKIEDKMKSLHNSKYLLIIFFMVFAANTNAQITLQVGGGLGYSSPSADMAGSTIDFYNGTKYGLESGFNIHGKARVGILFFNAFGEIGYTSFSGDGEAEPGRGKVDVSQKLFSIKVGPEFQLNIPTSPITPYLQGFVALNSYSGEVEFQGVAEVSSGTYDISSESRVGFGAGAGVLFEIGGLNLDLNIQYHLTNIGGKEYNVTDPTKFKRLDNYTSLNDEEDPLIDLGDDHIISSSRSLDAFEFKLSVMFGL
jgi:opacity protein-like surface antigen